MSKGMFRRARNMNASLGLVELLFVICKVSLKVGSGYSKVSRSTTSCSFINTIMTKATPSNRYPPDLHLQREYPCALFFMAAPALPPLPNYPLTFPRGQPYPTTLPYLALTTGDDGDILPPHCQIKFTSQMVRSPFFHQRSFNHGTNMPTLIQNFQE